MARARIASSSAVPWQCAGLASTTNSIPSLIRSLVTTLESEKVSGMSAVGRQCCLVAVAPHNHNLQRGTAPMAAALAGTLVDKSFQLPQGPGGIK